MPKTPPLHPSILPTPEATTPEASSLRTLVGRGDRVEGFVFDPANTV